jgi:hypothetical protein
MDGATPSSVPYSAFAAARSLTGRITMFMRSLTGNAPCLDVGRLRPRSPITIWSPPRPRFFIPDRFSHARAYDR